MGLKLDDKIIGVIGLGYVGLPLAIEFGKSRRVIGFDIREERVAELKSGADSTLEVEPGELKEACFLEFTSRPEDSEGLWRVHRRGSDACRLRKPAGPAAFD